MRVSTTATDHSDAVRRRVRHVLHGRFALMSAAIWTLGTLVLFVLLAAGNPRPIPMALVAMLVPLAPAVLPWLFFRPLLDHLTARELRHDRDGPAAR